MTFLVHHSLRIRSTTAWKFICLVLLTMITFPVDSCKENGTDEKKFQIPIDPESFEFTSEEQTLMNNFSDPLIRRILKRYFKKKESESKIRSLGDTWKRFDFSFCSSLTGIRVDIQHVLSDARELYFHTASSDVEYPPDFVSLNKTHDRWIDDETDREIDNHFGYKNYKPPTARIEKPFKLYYNLFSTSPSDLPHLDYYNASIIQEKLKRIHIKNPTKYPDMETVYKRFAATMARSSRMMYTMTRICVLKLFDRCARKPPDQEFTDVFFELFGTWYLTKEHMMFINLLKEALGHAFYPSITALNKNNEWVELPCSYLPTPEIH